jgi:two-component system sensor kinase FixL
MTGRPPADHSPWQAIFEAAVDGIVVIDTRGLIEAFNPAAERMFGYAVGEVAGRNVRMLMPPPFADEHDGYLERYASTRQGRIIGIGRDVVARRRDGSTFPVHLSVGVASTPGGQRFVGIIRDLTDRARLENRLREESGLARLGELAAVLAHEVKNPLAAVSGAVQMLADRLPKDDESQDVVREILARLDGLSALMSDLLLYARPPRPALRDLDLRDLSESLVAFYQGDPSWRDLQVVVEGPAVSVSADPELLTMALQNLLVNASQAMKGSGRIVVRTAAAGPVVQVDVIDDGPGLAEAARAHLFQPFYTTKARGTGLGLATVRRIAEAHQGSIEVLHTGPGGTTMRLTLPAAGLA